MISPFEELKDSRAMLISRLSNGESPHGFQQDYGEALDQYFRRSLQESEVGHRLFKDKKPFAFVSVGGYGREELCVHSDIDIIILFRSTIPKDAKDLYGEMFFPLWDLGLDVGYGIRNLRDCISLSKDDFEVLTSLMDARFVCGDSLLYLSLMESLEKKAIRKKARAFGRWLEDQNKIRMERFGDASFLLEPNLKEGIGGLRDYHHLLWLSKAFFNARTPRDLEYLGKLSHKEYETLRDHLNFIWDVRNLLHQLSGRKNDRLGFEHQEGIAGRLGFQDEKGVLAVERFLEKLHAAMTSIKSTHRAFILTHLKKNRAIRKDPEPTAISPGLHLHRGQINFDSATSILSNPFHLMEVFEKSATLGHPLSMETRRLVGEFLYLVDKTFRESRTASRLFLKIINGPNTVDALDCMFETGFLEAYIPEFKPIKDRVQFDAYHIYPVGRHCLETLKYLKGLSQQKDILFLDILSELPDPESLYLAGLFHDIGKIGEDHATKGVSIAERVLKRLGVGKKRAQDILFLIGHHLLLVETATRRDLNDEKMVVQCARTIQDVQRLKMLYLLTWADSRATGPRAWNEWIANLVQELFFKILHILQKQELASVGASRNVDETETEVRGLMAGRMDRAALNAALEVMSPRYVLETTPRDIIVHLSMVKELKGQIEDHKAPGFVLAAQEEPVEGCWMVTFLAMDRPGLFCDMAGVLALNNINILSAQIYTWRDGTALDIFKVTGPLDPIHPHETWTKVRRDLKNVFTGKLSLEYRLGEKATPSLLSETRRPARPPEVVLDNQSSDFFTLLEVFTNDRVGLLYMITRTLFDLKLDIRIAKISTKSDQVADVFYVRDLDGQKVDDKDQLKEIKRALLHRLTKG